MQRSLACLALAGAAITIASLYHAQRASATALNQGFTSTTLAVGRFDEIDVVPPGSKLEKHDGSRWLSWQKTRGPSDLYVQSNVWQPGGSTGWHTHPGHSLIIVTAGTLTGYEGNDPECKPHMYTQGMGFVDPGREHVHILRNETATVAKTIAVQLIPPAADVRIDVPDPGNCHF